jgi:two-component system LytT family response regulator
LACKAQNADVARLLRVFATTQGEKIKRQKSPLVAERGITAKNRELMKAVIVDDMLNGIVPILERYLYKYASDIEVCGTADTVEAAYELILNQKPDLVFLDVEIGDETGFDLLKKFAEPQFMVIFVTGHEQYAKQAIKYGALDYLSKPVAEEDFNDAVERAKQRKLEKKQVELLLSVYDKLLKNELPERMVIHEVGQNTYIELDQIKYLQADEFTTKFYLRGEKKALVSSRNLGYYEDQLAGHKLFVRAQKSYIINLREVKKYHRSEQCIEFKDEQRIPVGSTFKDRVLKALDGFSLGK